MSKSSTWRGGSKHPLTVKTVLRTIRRVTLLATAISAEDLAKELIRHGVTDALSAPEYLNDVWQKVNKLAPDKGEPLCQVCGTGTWRDRKHARYCSASCRQKAYRKRRIARHRRQTKRNETAISDVSPVTGDRQNVTTTKPNESTA
jgi:hypothetical protein